MLLHLESVSEQRDLIVRLTLCVDSSGHRVNFGNLN